MACANQASAARLFLQITHRRTAAAPTSPSSPRLLDILLPPPAAARFFSAGTRRSPSAPSRRARNATAVRLAATLLFPRAGCLLAAAFSSTPARRETKTLFNPQKDDDGNDMTLEITPRAAKRLSDIMAKDANPHLALRIQVESGGCHGFQYLMRLVTLPPTLPSDGQSIPHSAESTVETPVVGEDDTIFYDSRGGAEEDGLTAPKIILDQPSLELLKGSKVDFTMELIGSQFKIVDNPLATSSCGCGTSFDVKI